MADIMQPHSHGKGRRRTKKRVGIRLDMTPMVDVAFLLLTFFMLTTAFRLPQTMEISIPEDDAEKNQVKIAESNILQLRVDAQNGIFWNIGFSSPQRVDLVDLRTVIVDRSEVNITNGKGETVKDKFKLIVLIKIDRRSKYENMIHIVDELDLAVVELNRRHGLTEKGSTLSPRFAFAPMTDKDVEELRNVR